MDLPPDVVSAGTFGLAANKHPDRIVVGLVSLYIREFVATASPYLRGRGKQSAVGGWEIENRVCSAAGGISTSLCYSNLLESTAKYL